MRYIKAEERRGKMKVENLAHFPEITPVFMADNTREIRDVYIGDLLSWVMGRAPEDCAWLTIMSNQNVAAVATLADTSAVILVEGVTPDETLLNVVKEKGINLFSCTLTAYELAVKLSSEI